MNATRADIDDFLAQRTLAVVGVSRSKNAFGTAAYRELKQKGYKVYPINREASAIEGEPCYPNLAALPGPVDGVLVVTPPQEAEHVVQDAVKAGITRVWLQQGAASASAIAYCRDHNVRVVADACVLMFAEPAASFHKVHRFFVKVFGRLPH